MQEISCYMKNSSALTAKKKRNIFGLLFVIAFLIAGLSGQFKLAPTLFKKKVVSAPKEGDGKKGNNTDPTRRIFDLVEEKDGYYLLQAHLLKKKREEEARLANSEQYVLKTRSSGNYDCPTCLLQYGSGTIYLPKDAVLKYGVSTKGAARYPAKFYRKHNCRYEVQFVGNYYQCLLEEKNKIYYYLISDENMSRDTPLIQTPWNRTTN